MNKLILFFILGIAASPLFAQGLQADDYMRSGLKYPVVVAILLCIFIGISLFLLLLERRIRKVEGK